MKLYYVYTLRAEDSELPFYVGKTFFGSIRLYHHIHYSLNGQVPSAKASKIKALLNANKLILEEVVFSSENEQEVFDKERELIAFYGRKDNGTGILCNHTDGGEGASGKSCNETTRQAVAQANRERIWDESSRLKQSIKSKGRTLSTEAKLKVAQSKYKAIAAYTLDDQLIGTYRSISQASKELNTDRTNISMVLNGHKESVKKMKFKFT